MKSLRSIVIILMVLLQASAVVWAKPDNLQEPLIKVGLAVQQSQVTVSADTAFSLAAAAGKWRNNYQAKEKVIITVKDGRLLVNGTPAAPIVRIGFTMPKRGAADQEQLIQEAGKRNQQDQFLQVNGKRYRGVLEIRQTGKAAMTVINILPLEAYLYGVVPEEVSPSWPLEAVKAQAVAARSYAYTSINKHQSQDFDVCPTVHCQVYGGRDSEAARSNQAVDETRGMMATYRGNVITTFFHASSGGHTENSEHVWGTPLPYLKGVRDFDQTSPRYTWERRVPIAELSEKMQKNGFSVGVVTRVELSPLTKQPVTAADRGVSGRVKTIKITGTAGTVQISGAKFGSLLGLPSLLFELSLSQEGSVPAMAKKSAGRRPAKHAAPDTLLVSGRGAGHGIGLSQWGAKAMAEKAPSGNKQYYQEILTHYYQGVKIQRCYK